MKDAAWVNANKMYEALEKGTYATDLKVGDIVKLDLGSFNSHNFTIVAINEDVDSSNNPIPLSLIQNDVLPNKYQMTTNENTNGRWDIATFRTNTVPTILNALPNKLKDKLIAAKKISRDNGGNHITTYDKIWIPSRREICGGNVSGYYETTGIAYSAVYPGGSSGNSKRIKKNGNTAVPWMLRTSSNSNNARGPFGKVTAVGDPFGGSVYPNSAGSTFDFYTALGICLG